MASGWSVDEVTSFYSSYATCYDDEIERNTYPAPSVIGSWVLDHLANNLQDIEPLRILDLGCGTGQSSKIFFSQSLPNSVEIYGVDATPEVSDLPQTALQGRMLQAGKNLNTAKMLEKAKQYPFKQLICQDIEAQLPYEFPFDAILCVGVFDFIRHPHKLLASATSYLRRNEKGCFGLTLPESGGLNKFSEDEMLKLIHQAGLKLLRHERFFGYEDSETKETVYYHGLLLTV